MMAWGKRASSLNAARVFSLSAVLAVGSFVFGADIVRSQTVSPADQPKESAKKTKQKVGAKAAKPDAAKDPAASQQQLDAGIASLTAGKTDLAVQQLTAVISAGGLSSAQMARAQYQRGIAYRKQGKPALAISDLTQALYIKNGLVEADRADAMQNRIAAYRDAGLPDQDDGQAAKVAQQPRTAAPSRTAAMPAAPVSAPVAIAPGPAPTPVASLAPAETQSTASKSSALGGFFGNLFGGSSATTEAVAQPAPVQPKREVATSAWSNGTDVRPAGAEEQSAAPLPAKRDPYALKVPAPTSTGSIVQASAGGAAYSIQVAQLKTRAEAEAMAARVGQQFGSDLAGRQASITAVDQGGFGTLHRVTFGPFASANDWKPLCPKLLSAKLDCQPLKE